MGISRRWLRSSANTKAWLCTARHAEGPERSERKWDADHVGPAYLIKILPLIGEEVTGKLCAKE